MSAQIFQAGCILTPRERIEDGAIVIEGSRITAVAPFDQLSLPNDADILDARSCTIVPGMIDLHTHGGGGAQALDGTPETFDRLAAFYASHGVTGFLATIGGMQQHIEAGIDGVVAAAQRSAPPRGAAILGIHLEGPFLSPQHPGAFRPESIMPPSIALLTHYLERAQGHIRQITLAPELDGADDVIRLAVARGVVVGAGHTGATWDQMMHAVDVGVSHAIHTFNAMRPLHHREPGVLGAALVDNRLTAEIIADGIHVHPAAVRLLTRAKGPARVALITDSIGAAGLADGTYLFEEQQMTVASSSARLADGTLAGSMLTIDRGLANLVAFGAASLPEALEMASSTPARILGLHERKGAIAVGADADIVALDEYSQVQWTMVGGQIVYTRRGD